MKKTVLFAAAIVAASAVSAQTGEITSNRGENWLSQDGDWGLTIDAQPFLQYVGNLFNGNMNNGGPSFDFPNSYWAIQGKKLVDANTAYRGKLRIGFGSTKVTDLVNATIQPDPAPLAPVTVENERKDNYFALVLGGGLEKRIGSSRVVGVYGGEANIMLMSSKTAWTYGNALNADNPGVGEGEEPGTGSFGNGRTTERKNGSSFGFGLNAFAGVEWFCAPKISLGAEYTWGLMLMSQGYGERSEERWNPALGTSGGLETRTIESGPKGSSFGLDTGISGASINLNFYFQ